MNIPYLDSVLLGLVRLLLWIGFLYALKRFLFKGEASRNQVKTIAYAYAVYGSMGLIAIHLLVLISAYDFFTCLLLLITLLVIKYLDLTKAITNRKEWEDKRKVMLLKVLENVEDKDPIIDVHAEKPVKRLKINSEFIVATIAALVVVFVRLFLMKEDTYQLSPAWFAELNIIKEFGRGNWLSGYPQVGGQYAFMSLYAMFTGITDEIALESFGLIQSLLLCFVIFWFMTILTNSRITIPLITTLLFGLFFNIAPADLSTLTHAKQTWMALTFALPAFVFTIKPWILYDRFEKGYFISMLSLFLVIGFTSIFTYLILVPPFILLGVMLYDRDNAKQFRQALIAYASSFIVLLSIYWTKCYLTDVSFIGFVSEKLLSVSSYTKTSNLIVPYETLITGMHLLSGIALVIMLVLFRDNRKKWSSSILFLLYFNAILLIFRLDLTYLDTDLLNEVLPIFIPLVLGLSIDLLYNFRKSNVEVNGSVRATLIFLIAGTLAYYAQRDLLENTERNNPGSKELIDSYQTIKSTHLDYTYAVVNANVMLPLSLGSQHFISYQDFVQNYAERDSVYFANIEDKYFLSQNRRYILPPSVMVFLYNEKNVVPRINASMTRMAETREILRILDERGRKMNTILKNDYFEIVMIENVAGGSKIEDLL